MSPEHFLSSAAEAVRSESERRRGDDERRWLFGEEKQSPRWLVWLMAWAAVVGLGMVAVWEMRF
jgi:hypothetical protein